TASALAEAGKTTRVVLEPPAEPSPPASAPPSASSAPPPPPPLPPAASASSPKPDHTARDVLRWTTAGIAVVGLGLGVGFMLDARSKSDTADAFLGSHPGACANQASSTCSQVLTLRDDRDRSVTIGTVGFVVGGAALAATAALWLFWPRAEARTGGA